MTNTMFICSFIMGLDLARDSSQLGGGVDNSWRIKPSLPDEKKEYTDLHQLFLYSEVILLF